MEDNLKNRREQPPRARAKRAPPGTPGRPRLFDKLVRCGFCGRVFVPKITRTVGTIRHFCCPCCGVKFRVSPEQIARLPPAGNLRPG